MTLIPAPAPALVFHSAPTPGNSQTIPAARPYVLAVSTNVLAPQTDLARTPETPVIVTAAKSQNNPNLLTNSDTSQKKAPAVKFEVPGWAI